MNQLRAVDTKNTRYKHCNAHYYRYTAYKYNAL